MNKRLPNMNSDQDMDSLLKQYLSEKNTKLEKKKLKQF